MLPIVLSGGSGTRLWPVSRASFPKQFVDLVGESLLSRTLRRVAELGEPRVVAAADGAVLTRRALAGLGLSTDHAIFEPVGRNTAPALALACWRLLSKGHGGEVAASFPADHLIADEAAFLRAARLAERVAAEGPVVTLGIHPTEPATGYGYVELDDRVLARDEVSGLTVRGVRRFREKPDAETAAAFFAAGHYLWNAGMFVFRVEVMAAHLERLLPAIWGPIASLADDLSNLAEVYAELPAESIDVGVMERLGPGEQASIPCEMGWSDVGSWDEVARVRPAAGNLFTHAADDNFVYPLRDKVYALVGVEGLIVVDTDDALLLARKGAGQEVKAVVDQIHRAGRREAREHPFEFRPWGDFEVLRDTDRFKSKVIRVRPGQRLSYQSHRRRSEHWVIVAGHPEVTIDGETRRLAPGEHVFIPRGARHRIANPGEETVEFVEVQLGDYFGEDDIERYEDDFGRS